MANSEDDGSALAATRRIIAGRLAGESPSRRDIEHALREVFGVSAKAARRMYQAIASELGQRPDDAAELREQLEALKEAILQASRPNR